MNGTINEYRQNCWNLNLDSLGYGYIIKKRIKPIQVLFLIGKIIGVIIPACLAFILYTYYKSEVLGEAVYLVAGGIGILQFGFTLYLWAIQAEEKLIGYSEVYTIFNRLAIEFEDLARFPRKSVPEMKAEYEKLKAQFLLANRYEATISNKEARMGTRYGHWIRRRACATCGEVPVSLKPSNCNTCGNF